VVDDGGRYESKTVKAMRGTEARSIAKWQKDGWELVDQSTGTLQVTLNFRKRKPPLPVWQMLIGGAVAMILVGIIGVGALLERAGGARDVQATEPTPMAAASTARATEPTASATQSTVRATQPTPAATETSARPSIQVTDITVDELLDKLNSADMADITTGDRFRVTAELFWSDAWAVGAAGEFTVYLKAKGGADDLLVFVDEADAAGWQDGTRVEMVLESVEATINGETSDGWMKAQSVRTIAGGK
jgi:hypothetical protein